MFIAMLTFITTPSLATNEHRGVTQNDILIKYRKRRNK
jgi:hypothetical protein